MLDPGLKMRVATISAASATFLMAALAYNLGGLAATDAMQKSLTQHTHELEKRQEQLKGCTLTLRGLKEKKKTVEDDFRAEKEKIVSTVELQQKLHDDAQYENDNCETKLEEANQERAQEEDPEVVLRKLRFENSQMELSLSNANETIVSYRKALRLKVRAMRLEMSILRNKVTVQRATDRRRHEEELEVLQGQERLQTTDIGAGQRREGAAKEDAEKTDAEEAVPQKTRRKKKKKPVDEDPQEEDASESRKRRRRRRRREEEEEVEAGSGAEGRRSTRTRRSKSDRNEAILKRMEKRLGSADHNENVKKLLESRFEAEDPDDTDEARIKASRRRAAENPDAAGGGDTTTARPKRRFLKSKKGGEQDDE